MQGYNTLFQPGFDHAGISTQNVVERALIEEGTSRQELGREAFEERVWEWLHEYGGKILDDFRRIGASLDYRRSRFTMDDAYIARGDAVLRAPLPPRLDLPREPDHQLVPVPRDVALRPRARARGHRRHALDDPLPARGRRRLHPDRDRSAGDDSRRRRRCRASGRRAVQAPDRPRGDRAVDREPRAGDRRRARRARVRHRRAEDHACTRSDRLRDRPRPRPAGAELHRARRPRHRGRARRSDAGRGGREDPRLVPRARPAREARALSAQRRVLRALPLAHRAAHLAAVVVLDGPDQAAPARGAPERRDPLPPGEPAPLRDRFAR